MIWLVLLIQVSVRLIGDNLLLICVVVVVWVFVQMIFMLLVVILSLVQEFDFFDFDLMEVVVLIVWQFNGFFEMRSQCFCDDLEQEIEFFLNCVYLDLEFKWMGECWCVFVSGFFGYDLEVENFCYFEWSEICEIYL